MLLYEIDFEKQLLPYFFQIYLLIKQRYKFQILGRKIILGLHTNFFDYATGLNKFAFLATLF